MLDNNQEAFFALVRAGLWEYSQKYRVLEQAKQQSRAEDLEFIDSVDWNEIYRLASEQSLLGLILAGVEMLPKEQRPPKPVLLQWIADIQVLEKRNQMMNHYIRDLIAQIRQEEIYAILVKGQGVAQCYERPLWRSCGDIDLLLSDDNYERAKKLLIPLADDVETEYSDFKHQGMTIGSWVVELHGTLHTRLSKRIDSEVDKVQEDVLRLGQVRVWHNEDMDVFLPAPDEDVLFLFTHILHHFYIEGIGLRQICDLCRLLWNYRTTLDHCLFESRLKQMGLMSEWKSFAAFSVAYLGMPVEAMPFYSPEKKWKRKAEKILEFVLESGNFGHSRQVHGGGKVLSAWNKMKDFVRHTRVFPWDSVKFFCHFVGNGIQVARDK